MNILSKIKFSARKALLLAAVVTAVAGAGFIANHAMGTAAADSPNCDDNAVIYCGVTSGASIVSNYDHGNSVNSASSIQNIYSYFNISSSDVNAMGGYGVNGYVTSSGNVYYGNKLVATNAVTAGREYIAGGSTYHDVNGTIFYTRTPSVSFLDSALSAFVVLNSKGQFEYAILVSCGNPVTGHNVIPTPPTPKPNYTITKEVGVLTSKPSDVKYGKDVKVKPDTKVAYKITVDSTGAAPVTNLDVKDALPSDISFNKGTLTENGAGIAVGDFFGKGINVGTLKNGASTTFEFNATVDPNGTDYTPQCKAVVLNNVGTMTATGLPSGSSTATVHTYCSPAPVYACTDLNVTQNSRTAYTFTVHSSAGTGAKVTGYKLDLGDGVVKEASSSNSSYSFTYNYTDVGDRKAIAYVTFAVDGSGSHTVTSAACQKTLTIAAAPVYACTDLTSEQNSRAEYTYTISGEAKNGAKITGYKLDLGDGVVKTVTTGDASTQIKYTYADTGTRTAIGYVIVDVAGTTETVTSPACEKTVTIAAAPAAECTDLALTQSGTNPLDVSATATDVLSNGATLSNISFNWGDNTAATSNGTNLTATHAYTQPGTYTVVATLTFSPATVAKSTCQASTTIVTVMPTCNQLTLDVSNDNETVTVESLTYTANNGTYEHATLDWGDSSPVITANDITGQTHTYTGTGPYTIVATTYFMVNGQSVAVPGSQCQQTVSFTAPTTPPVVTPPVTPPVVTPPVTPSTPVTPATPTAPATLVNTGAGNVIGLFVAASVIGMIGYRYVIGRRLKTNQ
jgi:uncharacterized repeat protein (TIGR01451 family)